MLRAAVLSALLLAPGAVSAQAAQFCVGATGTACDGGTYAFSAAGLEAAAAAATTVGADELRLAAGTIDNAAPITGSDLNVVGAPRTQGETVVRFPAGTSVAISVAGAGSISNLTLDGSGGTAVRFTSPAGAHAVDRLRISGFSVGVAASATSGSLPIRDTLIDLGAQAGATGVEATSLLLLRPGSPPSFTVTSAAVHLQRVTIAGAGPGQSGASATSSFGSASVEASDAVIDLPGAGSHSLFCSPGSGTASAATSNSALRPDASGCGAVPLPAVNLALVQPWFVDRSRGDYRLQSFSPLVDAAVGPLGGSTTDARGRPRRVDGDGNGNATADIGAFEYQRQAPEPPTITVPRTTVPPGEALAFSAESADGDGEVPFITWDFGDGTPAGGNPRHAYAALGTYTATATATDPTGLTSTAQVQITVANPASTGDPLLPPTPAPADPFLTATGPRVRVLSAPAGPVRRRSAGFATVGAAAADVATLETAGAVTLRVSLTRLVPGRRTGGRCTTAAKRGKRCTARVPITAIGQIPVSPGTVHLRFGGKLGGRRLAKGAYEVRVLPIGIDKRKGTPATYPLTLR
jgi:hypothetical protein